MLILCSGFIRSGVFSRDENIFSLKSGKISHPSPEKQKYLKHDALISEGGKKEITQKSWKNGSENSRIEKPHPENLSFSPDSICIDFSVLGRKDIPRFMHDKTRENIYLFNGLHSM